MIIIFIIINIRKLFLRMVKPVIQILCTTTSSFGVKMEIKRILRGFSYGVSLSLQLNEDTLHPFTRLSSQLHPCKGPDTNEGISSLSICMHIIYMNTNRVIMWTKLVSFFIILNFTIGKLSNASLDIWLELGHIVSFSNNLQIFPSLPMLMLTGAMI